MTSCPACKKDINISVSGKFTCTCGTMIQIADKAPETIPKENHIEWLKNKLQYHGYTITWGYIILFLLMGEAWNNDLPNFLGPYSAMSWKILSSSLLLFTLFPFLFLSYDLYTEIVKKEISKKQLFKSSFYILILLILIIILLIDLGLQIFK